MHRSSILLSLSLALVVVLGSQVSTHAGGVSARLTTGLTSLNGLSGASQTFVADSETNLNLGISSSGTQHTFTMSWSGVLAKDRQFPATAYTDQNNTFLGTQNFSGGSLILPQSAGAAPSTTGAIAIDTTSNTAEIGVNGANKILFFTDSTLAGTQVSTPATGSLLSTNASDAITELEAEKANSAALATDDGIVNEVGDLVSWFKIKDIPAGFADGSDDGGGGGGSLTEDSVTNLYLANMNEGTLKCRVSTGTGDPEDCTPTQALQILDGLFASQTEIDGHISSTSAHGATTTPTALRIPIATVSGKLDSGWLPLPTSLTLGGVLASGNCNSTTGKMIGIGIDGLPVCGTDFNTGGTPTLQDVCTTGCVYSGAIDQSTAFRVGSVERALLIYADDVNDKVILTVSAAQDMEWQAADGFNIKMLDSDGSAFATFAEATKTIDFSEALVTKPFAYVADAAPIEDAECTWDATAHRLKCGENGTTRTVAWTSDTAATPSIQQVFNVGKTIFNANSLGNSFKVGVDDGDGNCNEAGEGCIAFYYDSGLGFITRTIPDAHDSTDIASGFAKIWRYNGTEAMRLDATTLKFVNSWRPLKSVDVPGYEFGACTYAVAIVATNKNKVGVFTCTDSDSDGFDFNFPTPLNWNAGTITVKLRAYSVNATPSGNVVLSCSGHAVSDSDPIPDKNTTGEQTVTLGMTTQYDYEHATSAAITLNGSPAAADELFMHCDIDATGTTATMADVRILAEAKVFYTTTQITE